MKKNALPDSFKKRELLNDANVSAERLIALGDGFLDQGYLYDAAAFFRKASHQEGMDRLKILAADQGDSFLFEVITRDSKDNADHDGWVKVGRKAMELKKFSHAVRAFRQAGNDDLLKEAEESMAKEAKG